MKVLLDTNVLSEVRRPAPDPQVLAWPDPIDQASAFTAVAPLAGPRAGVALLGARPPVSPIPPDAPVSAAAAGRWAPRSAGAGASSVTFHIEAARDPRSLARDLRALRVRAGMALKPGTPFAPYAELLPELDMVLVMTVEPGFGGQSFMADQMPKVREVREAVDRCGGEIWVQVDGGVTAATIEACAEAGADVFVAGSAVYGAEDAAAAVDQLRALAARHSPARGKGSDA